jgi:hypothetical protein
MFEMLRSVRWKSLPRAVPLGCSCLVGLWLTACGAVEPPVATLEVVPAELPLNFSEVRSVRLRWQIARPLDETAGELRVFVHVLERPGEVLRTFDHVFPETWSVGAEVSYEIDLYQSSLGPPLATGSYALSVGVYDESGNRWPLDVEGDEVDGAEYAVARIDVSDESATPMFRFSEGWAPVEPGLDRQILGRRWLTGAGSISAGDVTGGGSVWLKLLVPPVNPGDYRLVLDPGYQRSRVLIRNGCDQSEIELTGEGRHELEIPIEVEGPESGPFECEITFEPNFHLVTPGSPDRRTIQLEMLAWRSGG